MADLRFLRPPKGGTTSGLRPGGWVLSGIDRHPDKDATAIDATVGDALDRLYLLYKIEEGIKQADNGQSITQAEARERMAKWLK